MCPLCPWPSGIKGLPFSLVSGVFGVKGMQEERTLLSLPCDVLGQIVSRELRAVCRELRYPLSTVSRAHHLASLLLRLHPPGNALLRACDRARGSAALAEEVLRRSGAAPTSAALELAARSGRDDVVRLLLGWPGGALRADCAHVLFNALNFGMLLVQQHMEAS